MFIIWDRLFGSYQPETQKVIYGLTTGFLSHNLFRLVMQDFIDWFRPASLAEPEDSSTPDLVNSPEK